MNNKKGITLVELIIVTALLTIVLGAIWAMFKPVTELFGDTTANVDIQNTGEIIVAQVSEDIRFAVGEYSYTDTPTTSSGDCIGTVDGKVVKRVQATGVDTQLVNEGVYSSHKADLTFLTDGESPGFANIEIKILNSKGEQKYKITKKVQLLNNGFTLTKKSSVSTDTKWFCVKKV